MACFLAARKQSTDAVDRAVPGLSKGVADAWAPRHTSLEHQYSIG